MSKEKKSTFSYRGSKRKTEEEHDQDFLALSRFIIQGKPRVKEEKMAATIHQLKTWPGFFKMMLAGQKTFEHRKDDRGFRVGHILRLREWDPKTKHYTGRELRVRVTAIVRGEEVPGMPSGYVIMQTERALA